MNTTQNTLENQDTLMHRIISTLSLTAASIAHADHRDVHFINILGSTDIVMLVNTGTETIDLEGWRFCTQNSTSGPVMSDPSALDGIVLPPNGSFIIRYNNDALTRFPTHHNASDIGPLAPFDLDAYALSLYAPNAQGEVDFNDPILMSDHVQWKRALVDEGFSTPCSQVAQDAGLWEDASDWIVVRLHLYLIELQDQTYSQMHSSEDYNTIFECRADLSDDGVLDFFDVSAFIGYYSAMDPIADLTQDGNLTFFDVSTFLQAFSQGVCPDF